MIWPRCRLSTGTAYVLHWPELHHPELLPGEGQQRPPAPLASPGSLLGLVTCYDGLVMAGLAPVPVAPELLVLALRQRLLQGQPVPCCDPRLACRGGVMLVHDIRKNRSWVIDFREVAPLGIPLEGDLQKDTKVRTSVPWPTRPGL